MARALLSLRGRRGALALLATLAGCDAFYAVGPDGCDAQTPCKRADTRCDMAQRRCVPIVNEGAEPARACLRHAECASQVCDSYGAVAPQPGLCVPVADTGAVTSAAELYVALQSKKAVLLPAGTFQGNFQVQGRALILVGALGSDAARRQSQAPSVLLPLQEGPVLTVSGAARVVVDGVTLRGGRGTAGHGVLCGDVTGRLWLRRVEINDNAGRGVQTRCGVSLDQSIVGAWQKIPGNRGGGMFAEGDVTAWNSFILGNGHAGNPIGGLALVAPPEAAARRSLAYLTIADNRSNDVGSALQCVNGEISQLWRSLVFGNFGVNREPVGQCVPQIVATDDLMSITHGESVGLTMDKPPRFRASPGDAHLLEDSPVIDKVPLRDDSPPLLYDFDGDPRPSGPRADFGADEYVPPA